MVNPIVKKHISSCKDVFQGRMHDPTTFRKKYKNYGNVFYFFCQTSSPITSVLSSHKFERLTGLIE